MSNVNSRDLGDRVVYSCFSVHIYSFDRRDFPHGAFGIRQICKDLLS